MLCQFSPQDNKHTLKDFFEVPRDVYPVGRLDYDSEGLLILTNDKRLNNALLNPLHRHRRLYWVQVDGAINDQAIKQLQAGVNIAVDGKIHRTATALVKAFSIPPHVPERNPPVRFRKAIPTSWISMQLTEGKNRQVRKMTAAAGFPTLRLIRYSIEYCTIDGIHPGAMQTFDESTMYRLLSLKK